jgi:hypothetical protein
MLLIRIRRRLQAATVTHNFSVPSALITDHRQSTNALLARAFDSHPAIRTYVSRLTGIFCSVQESLGQFDVST